MYHKFFKKWCIHVSIPVLYLILYPCNLNHDTCTSMPNKLARHLLATGHKVGIYVLLPQLLTLSVYWCRQSSIYYWSPLIAVTEGIKTLATKLWFRALVPFIINKTHAPLNYLYFFRLLLLLKMRLLIMLLIVTAVLFVITMPGHEASTILQWRRHIYPRGFKWTPDMEFFIFL